MRFWLLIWGLLPNILLAQTLAPSGQPVIIAAEYTDPTTRYQHGVFGNETEFGALVLTIDDCFRCTNYVERKVKITLPESSVFEDLVPRLADLDGDGRPEVVVVETDNQTGARLAVYSIDGLITATPNIGTSQRWLAPAGIADLNGDGQLDIAYIETPHLGKTLKIWTMQRGRLVRIGRKSNLTNHRFGEGFISGGIRDCGLGAEVITADGIWRNIVASRIVSGLVTSTVIAPFDGQRSFERVLACN